MIIHGTDYAPSRHVRVKLRREFGPADSMTEWRYSILEARAYGSALIPEHGRIRVPREPGLGIDPDPDVLRGFRGP